MPTEWITAAVLVLLPCAVVYSFVMSWLSGRNGGTPTAPARRETGASRATRPEYGAPVTIFEEVTP